MIGKRQRKFTKLETISKHLYCSICDDVFCKPSRLYCGLIQLFIYYIKKKFFSK